MNDGRAEDYFLFIRAAKSAMPSTCHRKSQATETRGLGNIVYRKKTNHTIPRINMANPVEAESSASTDGPGSPCRASVGVSTIRPCCRVAIVSSSQMRPAAAAKAGSSGANAQSGARFRDEIATERSNIQETAGAAWRTKMPQFG
jgi:hypothetical protein